MPLVKLDTGFNIEVDFAIAPFYKRLFAWVIDIVIQAVYLWMAARLLNIVAGNQWGNSLDWLMVLYFLPVFFYHLACEIALNGQSIGKKAMGIKVITAEGGQPSLSQYLIRWMFKLLDFPYLILPAIAFGSLPWWTFLFFLGGVSCVLFTAKSQRIGDIIASTIVIDTRNRSRWQDTVFMEVEDNYQASFPQVMRLSDRDINTIKQILSTSRRSGNTDYAWRIAEKIKSVLKVQSNLPPLEFMELLLKDYNHLAAK
jgi:uncharacterized RDD family membrane protein YckC